MSLEAGRVRTGIPGVDEMIGGGLPEKSVTLVSGPPGMGKSNFALQFIYYGAKDYNEPGVYLTVEDTPENVKKYGTAFGWDIEKLEGENKVAIVTQTIYGGLKKEQHKADSSETLNQAIGRLKAKRVVLDSATLFKYLFPNDVSRRINLLNFIDQVKSLDCTTVMIAEQHESVMDINYLDEHFLADGLFLMFWSRHRDRHERCFRVVKMRGSEIMPDIRPYKITSKGLVVYPTQIPLSLSED
jgi:KaiC/GvpD/RAD55 family RecA-like ATPase